VVHWCVPENEVHNILAFYHSYALGGHFGGRRTTAKVLQSGFFLPTLFRDAHYFYLTCERCQHIGALSHRDIVPLPLF